MTFGKVHLIELCHISTYLYKSLLELADIWKAMKERSLIGQRFKIQSKTRIYLVSY
jgi:hypothetical protein